MKKFLLLCALLLAPLFGTSVFAQGYHYQSVVFNQRGTILGNARITVCTSVGVGQPCAPTANVYEDAALSGLKVNPFYADNVGNFDFWAAPGTYVVTITGQGITGGETFVVSLPCVPGSSVSGCGSTGGVSSVFARSGAVTAQTGDYSLSQISATYNSPLAISGNALSCPTCVTSVASLTNNAVMIGGGLQASSTIPADTTPTHALFATTAGAPAFRAIAAGDIPTLNQNTTGTAANLTGCTPSTAGSVCYWNGSVWTLLAGNASGTNSLQENSAGVPSWAAAGGGSAIINGVTCGTCNLGSLFDTNGNASVLTGTTVSAVNQITVTNAATGGNPSISATGTDANASLNISAKGTGSVNFPGEDVLFVGTTPSTASSGIGSTGSFIVGNGIRFIFTTGNFNAAQDIQLGRVSANLLGVSGSSAGDLLGSVDALGFQSTVANDSTTATVVNKLAIPSSAVAATVALTTTTHGVIGVVMSGAGTTGNAGIVRGGNATLIFDGAITHGDWFIPSTTTAGDGHDSGTASTAAPVTSCVGLVMAPTNATPGSTPQAVWIGCQ